jgi:hypothetical protein
VYFSSLSIFHPPPCIHVLSLSDVVGFPFRFEFVGGIPNLLKIIEGM